MVWEKRSGKDAQPTCNTRGVFLYSGFLSFVALFLFRGRLSRNAALRENRARMPVPGFGFSVRAAPRHSKTKRREETAETGSATTSATAAAFSWPNALSLFVSSHSFCGFMCFLFTLYFASTINPLISSTACEIPFFPAALLVPSHTSSLSFFHAASISFFLPCPLRASKYRRTQLSWIRLV